MDSGMVFHPTQVKQHQEPCFTTPHCWVPSCTEKGTASYRILVQTSDVRGAGTDSDVFITLYGPKGDSGERALESSANDFERGKQDVFMLTVCVCVCV